jgi:hypothetical protein
VRTRIVEAWSPHGNRAKFLVGVEIDGYEDHSMLVLDLQTGEAAVCTPPQRKPEHTDEQWAGLAEACARYLKINHPIWVVPLYQAFIVWLYTAALPFDELPERVELAAPFATRGYRRTRDEPTADAGRQTYIITRRHPR